MRKAQVQKEIIFFAYQGRREKKSDVNVDAITKAIQTYNSYQKSYEAKSWEDYKQTSIINIEILKAIQQCSIFVCDMTHFNHNVLFEFGYALAQDKEILILLNENVNCAKEHYTDSIFKSLKYTPFETANDIVSSLQKNCQNKLLNEYINISNITRDIDGIFYIESLLRTQPSQDLTDFIKKLKSGASYSVIVDDKNEVGYKPFHYYTQSILKAKAIIIHLLGQNMKDADIENAKTSFYAGLACGFDKKILLVAPAEYKAPLDYHDILFQYTISDELIAQVDKWVKEHLIVDSYYDATESKEQKELNLIKLGIGDDVAENEEDKLLNYFVETASYNTASKYKKSIIVGRKGSGKSAIYIKLLKEYEENKNSNDYFVILKPESDELEQNINLSNLYKDSGKKSFFFSVWILVFFSKLLSAIYEKLMLVEHARYSQAEDKVIEFYEKHEAFIKLNFFGIIKELYEKREPSCLEDFHKNYLKDLRSIVREYVATINTKYLRIIIIADNLDKTWDVTHDLNVQSEMIISLLELDSRIKKELIDKKGKNVDVAQIIFLRKDIFDYIRKKSNEPDKLLSISHEIDWKNYPKLLRVLVDNRFKFILNLTDVESIEKIWNEYFAFREKRHPFEVIQEIVTKRPRDVLYFITRLFESAINNGNSKVNDKDLENAIEGYSKFLNENLITEAKAEYPEITDVLSKLQKYHGTNIEYKKFEEILRSCCEDYNSKKLDKLIELLFDKEYLMAYEKRKRELIKSIGVLQEKLREKRFFGFRKNKVYIIAHAKYWLIKHQRYSPF